VCGGNQVRLYGSGSRCLSLSPLFSSLYLLALAEALETTKIHSVVAKLNSQAIIATRPFRSPHHTISAGGLVGGGTVPKRDEVSLARNGVLFLYCVTS
jgi:magnesium chelatase family protein